MVNTSQPSDDLLSCDFVSIFCPGGECTKAACSYSKEHNITIIYLLPKLLHK